MRLKKYLKNAVVLILLLVICISFCACKKKKDNLDEIGKDLTNYNINIDYNSATYSAICTQTVDYINSSDAILRVVKFHLYAQYFEEGSTGKVVGSTKLANAYPNGMSYSYFEVTRVQVNEQDVIIVYENESNGILSVNLFNSLMPTERISIKIEYNFTLPNCLHRFGYGENTINLGNFYPIACIYENGAFNTSEYNSNGDPFYSDMSNYYVNLYADHKLKVANTGEKTGSGTENGKSKYEMKAIAVRDFVIVLSEKFIVKSKSSEGINIEYYYFDDDNADRSLQAGVDAINTFSELFGDYPYSTMSIVKTDFVHGGMEYPGLIYISADIDNQDDYLNVIIHETAHQWWYNLVGNDEYKYPWLDEALTEYSTILFYNYNGGYNLNYKDMISASHSNYSLFVTVYTDVLGSIDTSMRAIDKYDTEPEYTYCVYVKGALMYDSLYQLIGEKKFIASLAYYFKTYKYKNATPDDLISAFEKTTGNDLTNFFDSWISGKVVIR